MFDRAIVRGAWRHFLLSVGLNFRSPQAIVYGYAVPVIFLFAFGALFRADTPPLEARMGQILTITILGGACFGLPTALVAERERGVWRRYRLLPVPTSALVLATLAARLVLVSTSVLLQLGLARLIFGTPWPAHPVVVLGGFTVVMASFLGIGLLIAALADDVPAVQALGQCLFLPMIMIGGVGVPLSALPEWSQHVSAFMPGRYAVSVLQCGFESEPIGRSIGFDALALILIGLSAGIAGAALFRWEQHQRLSSRARIRAVSAILVWIGVGVFSLGTGRSQAGHGVQFAVTDEEIAAIDFSGLPGDGELVTRLAPPFSNEHPASERVRGISAALATWEPARTGDDVRDVWRLLSVAAIADIGADLEEAQIARAVFDELEKRYPHARLRKLLAVVILAPGRAEVVTSAPELNLRRQQPTPEMVRERCVLYAKKFLGRLTGRITAP